MAPRPRRSGTVKREPGSAEAVASNPSSGLTEPNPGSTVSTVPIDGSEMPLRGQRSNAPPPTDPYPESEGPLLREVRVRQEVIGSPTNPEESFLQNSFQDIGKKLKACNDTLGELQQLGVSHNVPLPELVLVGDQSAGKSTLMSGLARLDLPRSEGTCTRCPLHIRVSRNQLWSCRVFLRKEYEYRPPDDGGIDMSQVTAQDPFFPWKKLANTNVYEFKTMSDQNQIEDVLRWAQVAILNDSSSFEQFIPGQGATAMSVPVATAAANTAAKFSPNIVALEIKGPDLPDLSFYDMPGIFQNPADWRDQYLTQVVRNLSSEYIQRPSAIILCGMAMNVDAENSFTMNLVRCLDASKRTIGVLTKADLLPLSSTGYDQWLRIMSGTSHLTGYGYFVTARKEETDLDELAKWEEHFFNPNSSENWPRDFLPFTERCGVEKLKAFLSERLAQEFSKSLPTIKRTVQSHLSRTTKDLARLPEKPNNVELEVKQSLQSFSDSARSKIDEYSRKFSVLPIKFRDSLLHMKPKFVLKDRSDAPVIDISDDDSDSAASMLTPTPKRRANGNPASEPRRPRLDGPAASFNSHGNGSVKHEEGRSSPVIPPSPAALQGNILPEPFAEFSRVGSGFRTIAQVREERREKSRSGMPGRILEEMYYDLVREAIEPWKGPARVFLKQAVDDLGAELRLVADKTFKTLEKRQVFKEIKRMIKSFLADKAQEINQVIQQLYEDERMQILTFNTEAFTRYSTEELASLRHFRHNQRMLAHGPLGAKPLTWELLNEEKRSQALRRREAEEARIGVDPFEEEIKVIAYVRAYYRVAALRYADAVSQCIICRLIPNIRRQLERYIDENLGLRVEDPGPVYERLMEEDASVAQKRATLQSEQQKFERALESIARLENGVAESASQGEDLGEEDVSMGDDMGEEY